MTVRRNSVPAEPPPPRAPIGAEAGALVAGYPVIRRIGSGARSELFLARSEPGPPIVLKVYRPEIAPESIHAEVSALSAGLSAHILELIDVASLPDGRLCLVLPHLGGGSLARRVDHGRAIDPGEAVTILAPLVAASGALWAAGLVHPALSPATVLFSDEGSPVVIGLGQLQSFQRESREQSSSSLDLAARRLSLVTTSVLHRVPNAADRGAERILAAVAPVRADAARGLAYFHDLEDVVFDFSEATPVHFEAPAPTNAPAPAVWSAAAVLREEALDPASADLGPTGSAKLRTSTSPTVAVPPSRRTPKLPGFASDTLETFLDTASLAGLAQAARAWLSRRWKPLAVGVGVAVAALVLVLTLTGDGSGVADAADGTGQIESDETSDDATSAPSNIAAAAAPDPAVLAGDEPVAAARELLRGRERCLSLRSSECLDGVDQAGSALLAWDRQQVAAEATSGVGGAGALNSPDPMEEPLVELVELVERHGDSAVLTVTMAETADTTEPASILIVRNEAGWRLREIFEP